MNLKLIFLRRVTALVKVKYFSVYSEDFLKKIKNIEVIKLLNNIKKYFYYIFTFFLFLKMFFMKINSNFKM